MSLVRKTWGFPKSLDAPSKCLATAGIDQCRRTQTWCSAMCIHGCWSCYISLLLQTGAKIELESYLSIGLGQALSLLEYSRFVHLYFHLQGDKIGGNKKLLLFRIKLKSKQLQSHEMLASAAFSIRWFHLICTIWQAPGLAKSSALWAAAWPAVAGFGDVARFSEFAGLRTGLIILFLWNKDHICITTMYYTLLKSHNLNVNFKPSFLTQLSIPIIFPN